MTNRYNYKPLLILYFNTIIIIQQNFKCCLTGSLRVPPLQAYDLSNFDVILLLFGSLASSPLS